MSDITITFHHNQKRFFWISNSIAYENFMTVPNVTWYDIEGTRAVLRDCLLHFDYISINIHVRVMHVLNLNKLIFIEPVNTSEVATSHLIISLQENCAILSCKGLKKVRLCWEMHFSNEVHGWFDNILSSFSSLIIPNYGNLLSIS